MPAVSKSGGMVAESLRMHRVYPVAHSTASASSALPSSGAGELSETSPPKEIQITPLTARAKPSQALLPIRSPRKTRAPAATLNGSRASTMPAWAEEV